MDPHFVIINLEKNKTDFQSLLSGVTAEESLWKPAEDRWCLLEVVCHLYDEEREDFRVRIESILNDPKTPLPKIDPQGWVKKRKYLKQNYGEMLIRFFAEREKSIKYLKSLDNPQWDSAYKHKTHGPQSAGMFLTNWLAHDYLHLKQIVRLKYDYLAHSSGESLQYAGQW
jgi:hypothetical protein